MRYAARILLNLMIGLYDAEEELLTENELY